MSSLPRPLLGLLLWVPGALPAAVHLCVDAGGHHLYQQHPCAGSNGGAVELSPLNSLGDPLRPGERQLLRERQRRTNAAQRERAAGRRRAVAAETRRERQQQRCWKQQQGLEQVNARLRRGYKPAQGTRLRDRRRALEDYLRRYCR